MFFRPSAFMLPLVALAALVPFSAAHAQTSAPLATATATRDKDVESNTFTLRWIKPSRFIANLAYPAGPEQPTGDTLMPAGLRRISSDDTTGRVFVQGTPEALAQIQEISRLLDVDPRRVRLSIRILRAPANQVTILGEPDQKLRKGEVVSSAAALFQNNEANTLYAFGDGKLFRVPLTPHINGDYSVSVAIDLSSLPASVFSVPSLAGIKESKTELPPQKHIMTRRVQNGAMILAAAGPDVKNKDLAYYLEITPIIVVRQEP